MASFPLGNWLKLVATGIYAAIVQGSVADGAAPTANPVLIAGSDGTNTRTLKTGSTGEIVVDTLPAGNNNIGDVDIASALPAGTNIIGKFGIDQTTPGTTNAVQVTGLGEVQASPTANTVLDRLKTIGTKDFATQATLAAVLAKLTADPATQTTLAAILAKIIATPATEAKQDTLIAKDFATQTTLAAILAKIIAAPATSAKQDTLATLIGALADAAVIDPTATGSEIALLKGIIAQLQGNGTAGKAAPVQLTGSTMSKRDIIKTVTLGANAYYTIGLTTATTDYYTVPTMVPISLKEWDKIIIVLHNKQATGTINLSTYLKSFNDNTAYGMPGKLIVSSNLAAGTTTILNTISNPELSDPYVGLVIQLQSSLSDFNGSMLYVLGGK